MSPFAPRRPCSHPGCPELTSDGSRCEKHLKQERQEYDRRRAKDPAHTFYTSTAWREARARQLRREPLCRECQQSGRVTVATVVDHITPLAQGGERYDLANLQSLCGPCHSAKSIREGSRYG